MGTASSALWVSLDQREPEPGIVGKLWREHGPVLSPGLRTSI